MTSIKSIIMDLHQNRPRTARINSTSFVISPALFSSNNIFMVRYYIQIQTRCHLRNTCVTEILYIVQYGSMVSIPCFMAK